MLDTDIRLLAVRRNKLWVSAKDRRSNASKGSECATPSSCCEHCGRLCIRNHLFECLHAVLLSSTVQKGEWQAVVIKADAGAYHPFLRRAPGQAKSRTKVVFVGWKR